MLEITQNYISSLDILQQYPNAKISFSQFLTTCSTIKPRYYSISSSPTKPGQSKGVCQITVGVLSTKVSGKVFKGFSSHYLAKQKVGSNHNIFINPAMEFHLPEDLSKPIVMIGAGTGLAPFMGYLENIRQAKNNGDPIGENVLFFGCRKPEEDCILPFCYTLLLWCRDHSTN
jgi:cytochrome P450/NADPH-cytochrome P450 reductase